MPKTGKDSIFGRGADWVSHNHDQAVTGPGSSLVSVFVLGVGVLNDGFSGFSSVVLPAAISILQKCVGYVTDLEANHFVQRMGPFIKPMECEDPKEVKSRAINENQQLCRKATSIAFAVASVCISPKRVLFSELGAQVCSVLPPVTVMGQTFAPQVLGYHLFGALSNVTFEPMELEDGGGILSDCLVLVFHFLLVQNLLLSHHQIVHYLLFLILMGRCCLILIVLMGKWH